jgi:hypothetical protein
VRDWRKFFQDTTGDAMSTPPDGAAILREAGFPEDEINTCTAVAEDFGDADDGEEFDIEGVEASEIQ